MFHYFTGSESTFGFIKCAIMLILKGNSSTYLIEEVDDHTVWFPALWY
jgi:hypothetical protein